MPEIKFLDVSKHYGTVKAVTNLNFTIYDGEYLSLLGPSGCGKTTTLRMLSGLIIPTRGRILWDDKPVQDLPPDKRDIGYVFQQFAIFPHMNLWENIAYPLEVQGLPQQDVEDKVEEYLDLVGLKPRAHLFPHDVPAADLQRTGIARVLARGAKVLLLDEPFGALDIKVREQFQDELRGIVKRLNLTAIHVTHDQSEAMAISDRIGVMKKGKMIQLDSPMNLLFRPSQIFAAHFIGESNFLDGIVIEKHSDFITVELVSGRTIRVSQGFESFFVGDRVVVGFRKSFAQIRKEYSDNCIPGIIKSDRFLGEKIRTQIELDYGRHIELIRLPHTHSLSVGDKTWVYLPPENLLLFIYPREGLEDTLEVT